MKKLIPLLMVIPFLCFLFGCNSESNDKKDPATLSTASENPLSPEEKLNSYIDKNGKKDGDTVVLYCPDVTHLIKESSFSIGAMSNIKGTLTQECALIKNTNGVSVRIIDKAITDNGMKIERNITIFPDGTFDYSNGMVVSGTEMITSLKGEISIPGYSKDSKPVITETSFPAGAKMTDAVETTLKDYVDLALDCYSSVLSQDGIDIKLSDIGYTSYKPAK